MAVGGADGPLCWFAQLKDGVAEVTGAGQQPPPPSGRGQIWAVQAFVHQEHEPVYFRSDSLLKIHGCVNNQT